MTVARTGLLILISGKFMVLINFLWSKPEQAYQFELEQACRNNCISRSYPGFENTSLSLLLAAMTLTGMTLPSF